jgi:hypothetical protein
VIVIECDICDREQASTENKILISILNAVSNTVSNAVSNTVWSAVWSAISTRKESENGNASCDNAAKGNDTSVFCVGRLYPSSISEHRLMCDVMWCVWCVVCIPSVTHVATRRWGICSTGARKLNSEATTGDFTSFHITNRLFCSFSRAKLDETKPTAVS